jgi:hypothetical protein
MSTIVSHVALLGQLRVYFDLFASCQAGAGGSVRVRIFVWSGGSGRVENPAGRVGSRKIDPWTTPTGQHAQGRVVNGSGRPAGQVGLGRVRMF